MTAASPAGDLGGQAAYGTSRRTIRELRLDASGVRGGEPLPDIQEIGCGHIAYLGPTETL